MPAATAPVKQEYACEGCRHIDSDGDPECQRDKSGSRKEKKRKEKSSNDQKRAAGGDSHCKNDKEFRRVVKVELNRGSHSKLDQDSKEELIKDKPGKDKKGKDAKDSKSNTKRKETRSIVKEDNSKGKDRKYSPVYSCTSVVTTDEKSCGKCNAKKLVQEAEKLCTQTEKQLEEIAKEMKQREIETKQWENDEKRNRERRALSRDKKKCQKSTVKLGKKFKCKTIKNPNLTQIGNSAEANCARCCELIGLYLKETYRFYTCARCCREARDTQFQVMLCLLMKSLRCMCHDCYMLVRYIWRFLFV